MSLDFPNIEKKILKFWQENKIFEKLRDKNRGKERWSFLDGPITANNPMGVHHAWGRTYKDLFQRYKALSGFEQRFQNGFDCQGLWVEVEVEKEKGFKTKKDIEKFGIENFVNACKERVKKYSEIQTKESIRLGQWMDWENSYYTMSDENNYAIWHFLKICRQKGLLYKGRDVVPWCPRCGTAISQHEILTEEYKEICHKAIFLKLPVIGRKKTFFLVWTTTPWTLPANVAIALHPEFQYVEVEDKDGDVFILLKNKSSLIPDGKVIKEVKGEKLGNLEYQGLFDELPAVQKEIKNGKHRVLLWEEISQEEGTGIVHIAPGCGQEDFQLSKKLKLPIIDPTNEESRYKEGFGFLTGKLATEVKDLIFEDLTKKGFVFKIEDYLHRYPTCWRCKSELIFRLVDEWYISMEKLRELLMEAAKKTEWLPSFGLGRELDWLKNMQDWLISKKRYWGLALPIFECQCGNFEVIGSKEELKERTVEGWKEFEGNSPHRPWVDKVKIKCKKCGEKVSRIADVGNPWLDAGIVPFSTLIDPETGKVSYWDDKKYWGKWFPADFICESFPGQFKNWFYAILVMSVVLENKAPVKTIFGYASVRDEKGEEMHKSKGNVIWFDEGAEKIGADVMRWMYVRQNPVYNLKFGYGPAEEAKRKLLNLWNSFCFFKAYVVKEEIADGEFLPQAKNILDQWIISRLHNLIEKTTRNLNKYNAMVASLSIEKFFIEDLSLWYIRRSRKRFHPEPEQSSVRGKKIRDDFKETSQTLYYVLLNLAKLISPFLPFFSEEIYSGLRAKNMPPSVHLNDWPKSEKKLIDKELEEKMKKVREIVNLALAERAKFGIKVRQPLASLKIKNQISKIKKENDEMLTLIKEEINVKAIVLSPKIKNEVELDTKITPELKEAGQAREIIRHIQSLRKIRGLVYTDEIEIVFKIEDSKLQKLLKKLASDIKKEAQVKSIKFQTKGKEIFDEKAVEIDGKKILIMIKKL